MQVQCRRTEVVLLGGLRMLSAIDTGASSTGPRLDMGTNGAALISNTVIVI